MNCLLFLSIISIVIISGEALRCYECMKCDDVTKVQNIAKPNCSFPNLITQCVKLEYTFRNGTSGINRGCTGLSIGTSGTLRATANESDKLPLSMSTYFCDTDLCNNSESLYSSSTLIFITIVTFICAIKNLY